MTGNPYMKRAAAVGSIAHGGKSEARVSKVLGARLQPASGAMRGAKSDMLARTQGYKFRVESKSTVKDTMGLDLGWLTKIGHEASQDGSVPALTLSFVTSEGKARTARNAEWVCVPMWFFQEALESLGQGT